MPSFADRLPLDPDLPLIPVADSHHTCRLCAGGCHSYDVLLTEAEARRLSLNMWRPLLWDVPGDAPLVVLDEAAGQYTLNKIDGRCVFLDSDNLCIVHKSSGLHDKPIACQFFPFQTVQAPDGVHVSLNVGCRRLIEMNADDAPLDLADARRVLNGVQSIATVPEWIEWSPDVWIGYADLQSRLDPLRAIFASDRLFGDQLREAALYLVQGMDSAADPDPRALWRSLVRLIDGAPPTTRSTLTALYARSHPNIQTLLDRDYAPGDDPNRAVYFRTVARQHLDGLQFALHRTARTGLVAFVAALMLATVGATARELTGQRPDHALNEALSDAVDLMLAPVGQYALTEPNQAAFVRTLMIT